MLDLYPKGKKFLFYWTIVLMTTKINKKQPTNQQNKTITPPPKTNEPTNRLFLLQRKELPLSPKAICYANILEIITQNRDLRLAEM